jgi:meso-butanediol dehydrogenase/(S,S)-butanediol dehydrogenase/diacetyl reductase
MSGGRFTGKAALVTGAGSGIGRAVTIRLASEGAAVTAVDIDGERLDETAARLAGDGAGSVTAYVADLTSPDACAEVVAGAVQRHGRLDILGNIAGVSWAAHVTDVTVEEYRAMMAVNVDAYFFLAQRAIPHLLETSGCIVNVASNAGLIGQAYTVVYAMTKGAVVQLTRSLAMEFVKTPLRVNAIAPAAVNTNLMATFRMPADVDFDLVGRYMGFRPAAEAEDVAGLFAYLAGDDARSIHGAIVSIDNGVTAG